MMYSLPMGHNIITHIEKKKKTKRVLTNILP